MFASQEIIIFRDSSIAVATIAYGFPHSWAFNQFPGGFVAFLELWFPHLSIHSWAFNQFPRRFCGVLEIWFPDRFPHNGAHGCLGCPRLHLHLMPRHLCGWSIRRSLVLADVVPCNNRSSSLYQQKYSKCSLYMRLLYSEILSLRRRSLVLAEVVPCISSMHRTWMVVGALWTRGHRPCTRFQPIPWGNLWCCGTALVFVFILGQYSRFEWFGEAFLWYGQK